MRDRRHAAAVTTIAMIFAAFGVRCGGGGGIEPTPLVPTESLSASGCASSLPPVFKPECIPTTRPANGIGPCGCPAVRRPSSRLRRAGRRPASAVARLTSTPSATPRRAFDFPMHLKGLQEQLGEQGPCTPIEFDIEDYFDD